MALIKHGSLTRTELVDMTGLSRATISTTSTDLIRMNLIKEAEHQPSTGGRPAIILQFAEKTHLILGIEFRRTEKPMWVISAFDLTFNVIVSEQLPADVGSPTLAVKNLASHIKHFTANLDITLLPVIGIGLPGLINSQNGMVLSVPELNWYKFNIVHQLQEDLKYRFSILNHFKANTLYEYKYGGGRYFNNLIYIGINHGIGGGIFRKKKAYGSLEDTAEIGHMTIEPEGPECSCGNFGCLEIVAAAPAIEKELYRLAEVDYGYPSAREICIAADQDDELALKSIKKAARYFGIAMANLINIYSPECFILDGFVIQNSRKYVEIAENEMRRRSLATLSKDVEVHIASHSEYRGALGAAYEALEKNISIDLF